MSPATIICRLSEWAEAGIASPWSLPAYIIARIMMAAMMEDQLITVILSDFANAALLLMAIASARRSAKMEKQIQAMAEANPDVDDKAIAREVG